MSAARAGDGRSLLLLPAAAADTQQSGAERYPTIYVHGLMGWGEHDQIYAVTPYWGLTSDLMPYLTGKGYESYAASVGPASRARGTARVSSMPSSPARPWTTAPPTPPSTATRAMA